MSQESLRDLLEASGSFPDESDVRANFDALFTLAKNASETVDDLAWGFLFALDQWSQVHAVVDPVVAQRLREWIMTQWSTTPHEHCKQLCRLLVNLRSPEVLAFLKQQRDECIDVGMKQVLGEYLSQMGEPV